MQRMRTLLVLIFILLPLAFCDAQEGVLTVAFLDVGQGDAIYIEAPNGNQMIIDGGPGMALLSELEKVMPFGDRTIDVLMVTNPDTDHYAGFVEVLKLYDVGSIVEPGTRSETNTYAVFDEGVVDERAPRLLARKGMEILLDTENSVAFRVLFPDQDVSAWARNEGSIMGTLTYGEAKFMFTGDSTIRTENILLQSNTKDVLDSDVLKVGHHGSRTSSGDEFVWAVSPVFSVISDGKENRYGHPHTETLQTLTRHGSEILRTDTEGTITLVSDGKTTWRK